MTEKLGPALPPRAQSQDMIQGSYFINSLVSNKDIAGSDDLAKLDAQTKIDERNVILSTQSRLNGLKNEILGSKLLKPVRPDNSMIDIGDFYDSTKTLSLDMLSAYKKFGDITKNGIQIEDGAKIFGLKNSIRNIYAHSLKNMKDFHILSAYFKKIDQNIKANSGNASTNFFSTIPGATNNVNSQNSIMSIAHKSLVEAKRDIESIQKQSKEIFYKIVEALKAIELMKRTEGMKNSMKRAYNDVVKFNKQVITGSNLDSERINLKRAISDLEEYMDYSTKLAGAIKNTSNEPKNPYAVELNKIVSNYEKLLKQPKKNSLMPVVAPKPNISNTPTNRPNTNPSNIRTSGIDINPTQPNLQQSQESHESSGNQAIDHMVKRRGRYLTARRKDGGYFDWAKGHPQIAGSSAEFRPPIMPILWRSNDVYAGQCGKWVKVEIRNNPFYRSFGNAFEGNMSSAGAKVGAIDAVGRSATPQIGGACAIKTYDGDTTYHFGFVHSINSDGSINVISCNAFGDGNTNPNSNPWQFPCIATYPRANFVAFSRSP